MNSKNPIAARSRRGKSGIRSTIQRTLRISLVVCGLLASFQLTTIPAASSQYVVEVIGNSLKPSDEGIDAPGVVLLLNSPFPKDGVVYAFQAYFRFLETTAFQIWRPTASNSSASGAFTLIAEMTAKPSAHTESIYISSRFTDCIRVRTGDMFGVLSLSGPSSISYVFNPFVTRALVYSAPNATLSPKVGESVVFRSVTFPYDQSCQAFYYLEMQDANSFNETTVECPRDLSVNDVGNGITTTLIPIPNGQLGATGPQGPKGAKGYTGYPGLQGPKGILGLEGPDGSEGIRGVPGPPGVVGPIGPEGDTGDTGSPGPAIPGPIGASGPMGSEGPPGQVIFVNGSQQLRYAASQESQDSESDWSKRWTTELFMIGLLIWLSIISVIVLVLLLCLVIITCVICGIRRQDERTKAKVKEFHHRESDPYGSIRNTTAFVGDRDHSEALVAHETIDGTLSTFDFPRSTDTPTWKEAMKDDSVQEYNVWHVVQ